MPFPTSPLPPPQSPATPKREDSSCGAPIPSIAKEGPNASGLVSPLKFKAALFEYLTQGANPSGFVEYPRPMSNDCALYTIGAATPQKATDFSGCKAIALINGPFNPNNPGNGVISRYGFRLICYSADRNDCESLAEYLLGRMATANRANFAMKGQCFHSLELLPGLGTPAYDSSSSLWLDSVGFRVWLGLAEGC